MKKILYILLLVTSFLILFSGIFEFANAQSKPQTLIEYPKIEGTEIIGFGIDLPQLIKYIYFFAVGICGAIALASILFGAIKYIGAAGNPSKMGDAKEQIFSAVLGVILLLSSYLILYTINPDLVSLGLTLPVFDTSRLHSGSNIYRCVCECNRTITYDRYTRNDTITVVLDGRTLGSVRFNKWGTTECKLESSYIAWEDCQDTCRATAEHQNLGVGCSKNATDLMTTLKYKNSSIETASLHEPYYPSNSDTSCGTWNQ